MKITMKKVLLLMIILSVILSGCSSENDNQESANKVAKEWIFTNTDKVSDELAKVISKDYALFGSLIIKTALISGINWTYSSQKKDTDEWYTKAIAQSQTHIPLSNTQLVISGNISFDIDTSKMQVTWVKFEPNSFKYQFIDI